MTAAPVFTNPHMPPVVALVEAECGECGGTVPVTTKRVLRQHGVWRIRRGIGKYESDEGCDGSGQPTKPADPSYA